MRKPISTKMHAMMDLLTAGMALTLPRMLNCSEKLRTGMTCMALTKLGYGLMTRHELGFLKKIPMKTHLVLDTIGGATMAALPFMVDEEDPEAITCCVAMGMLDVAAAPLTQTHSRPQLQQGAPFVQRTGVPISRATRGRSPILS